MGVALQKVTWATRKEGRVNLPLPTASVPPLWVKLEPPHWTQLHKVSMSLSSLVNNLGAPSSAESSVKKEKGKDGKDKLKKKNFLMYFCAKFRKKGVYYLKYVLWPPC